MKGLKKFIKPLAVFCLGSVLGMAQKKILGNTIFEGSLLVPKEHGISKYHRKTFGICSNYI